MLDFITFDYFRMVFLFLLVVLVINILLTFLQKKDKKVINASTVIGVSLIALVVSLMSLYTIGNITDEYNFKGDSTSTYMVIAIGILSIINLLTFFFKNREV